MGKTYRNNPATKERENKDIPTKKSKLWKMKKSKYILEKELREGHDRYDYPITEEMD